jgi:CDP-diacylglycerol--glycerol-3-phosphate 3-phosphatidyltransferase
MSRTHIWTLANAITASRFFAGPICIWLLTSNSNPLIWIALAVMVAAETTDLIDGYVARSSQRVSNLGKILDPLADSIYHSSVFIAFVINGWMPIWMFAIIVWRDLTVSYLRELAELRAETLGARMSGKIKAVTQGIAQLALVLMVALYGVDSFAPYSNTALGILFIATAVTVYSFCDYVAGVTFKLAKRA